MFNGTTLNPQQKKIAFDALKHIQKDRLYPILVNAAFENLIFPSAVETAELSALKTAYKTCMHLGGVRESIENTLSIYFSKYGYQQFDNQLTTPFITDQWSTQFLIYLINQLNISIEIQPLVVLSIEEGKVYWKYICGTQLLHDRTARKNPANAFDFDAKKTITMTWEEFRRFKDAGKRGGSVAITKDRFTLQFKRTECSIAETIWAHLKGKGMLDHNDRLSLTWRCYSGNLALPRSQDTIHALTNINTNSHYAEILSTRHNATLFRSERSPKKSASTGLITSNAPRSEPYQVKKWDVSRYTDLNNHATTDDDLDHDHIPSANVLKQFSTEKTIAENKDGWGCIAIPHAVHKQGLSNAESSRSQKKNINKPFLDEVTDYLNKLEHNAAPDYLEALGAFRYLYRENKNGKFGTAPSRFFAEKPELRKEIDQLFMNRLEQFVANH
jgi:hypothetical protein